MEFLNNLIIDIFHFVYYFHIILLEEMYINLLEYPFASILVFVFSMSVLYFSLYSLFLLKYKYFCSYNCDKKEESRKDTEAMIVFLLIVPFLLPIVFYYCYKDLKRQRSS